MKYTVVDTGKHYLNTFRKVSLEMNAQPMAMVYDRNKEYRLQLTIGCIFRANDEIYSRALEHAQQKLKHHIFGDVKNKLNDIVAAVYGGDADSVLGLVNQIDAIINKFDVETVAQY